MSEIVKEKPIMEEAHKMYNNFIRSRLMMTEYEKKNFINTTNKYRLKIKEEKELKKALKKEDLPNKSRWQNQ